jgi:hypothetical protein
MRRHQYQEIGVIRGISTQKMRCVVEYSRGWPTNEGKECKN